MVGNARAFYAIGPLCDYFLALLFQVSTDYLSSTYLFGVCRDKCLKYATMLPGYLKNFLTLCNYAPIIGSVKWFLSKQAIQEISNFLEVQKSGLVSGS